MNNNYIQHVEAAHFRAFAIALTARDPYTGYHCERTWGLADQVGRACGLDAAELSLLHTASVMHDIGKVAIPDHILLKPGRFEPDERLLMQLHAERGAKLLMALQMDEMGEIADLVLHHHEAFNGSGYPDGIAGEKIPIASRIIAVCDSYDAMATTRPYHAARAHIEVMRILDEESAARIDPYVFEKFKALIAHSEFRAP